MRVACFYPSQSMFRAIHVPDIWTSPRGLTGSELAFIMYSLELSRLGHSVTMFSRFTEPSDLEKITCCPYEEWSSIYHKQHWDALCSWMLPEPLRIGPSGAFRLYNQQVSDFNLCGSGWEGSVDVIAPLSNSHARYVAPMAPVPREKWRVMYNGVDLRSFRPGDKVRGKMLWASSHDRGLHWLLEAFPKVRKAVPWAELHVCYDFGGVQRFASLDESHPVPHMRELGRRSRYVLEAVRRLDGKGVHVHQSVSRERIVKEMSEAEVLAYPCDPVHYTETFGVTVLEACASGTVPVLCAADAFSELWGGHVPSVPPPFPDRKQEYVDLLVRTLSDDGFRRDSAARCVERARTFSWKDLAAGFEKCLATRGREGLPEVVWS